MDKYFCVFFLISSTFFFILAGCLDFALYIYDIRKVNICNVLIKQTLVLLQFSLGWFQQSCIVTANGFRGTCCTSSLGEASHTCTRLVASHPEKNVFKFWRWLLNLKYQIQY